MARKSSKSNKARITKQRRQAKAAPSRNPWLIAGVAFCLGVIVTAGAFAWTPLGAFCGGVGVGASGSALEIVNSVF